MLEKIILLFDSVVQSMQTYLEDWLPGLVSRFLFAGILAGYYWNSALTKITDFSVNDKAYVQILPHLLEDVNYDVTQISFIPWGVIVHAGTYAEFILPALIIFGIFTRLSALGMIGFIVVQSFVDIIFHNTDKRTIGALFDRFPDAVIVDQRLLWVFLLFYLILYGPGRISVDSLLSRWYRNRTKKM